MLENYLSRECESIKIQMNQLQKKLELLPQENLLCVNNGKYTKWFVSNGKNPIYIPKSKKDYAEKLAVKKLYEIQKIELSEKLKTIERILTEKEYGKSSKVFSQSSGYRELLESHYESHPESIQSWLEEPYEHNSNYPENLIHETYSGQLVRSKSEVIIANTLYNYKVPFRYECPINLGNIIFYPDFTILHPKTEQIYYWEHLGMMSDPAYRDKTYNKLKAYGTYNIYPSENLIATYESKTNPINSYEIEQLVQEKFAAVV